MDSTFNNYNNVNGENIYERMYQSEDELMLSQCIINEFERYEQRRRQCDNDYLFALAIAEEEENQTRANDAISCEAAATTNQRSIINQVRNDSDYKITNLGSLGGGGGNEVQDCFVVNGKRFKTLVDPDIERLDPNPDIWHLFTMFDKKFFSSLLTSNGVELNWSSKMTLCAGLCRWNPRNNLCSIRLSTPLLQLRSRSDLVETLLHEMIHALLFVTHEDDNHESHGVKFHMHMIRINELAGTNITVYHNFNNEVRYYQKHVWRCDGRCRDKAPYFGYVRRAMNRKPGPSDFWYRDHMQACGGNFIKISENEVIGSKNSTVSPVKTNSGKRKLPADNLNQPKIDTFFQPKKKTNEVNEKSFCSTCEKSFQPFSGKGFKLGSCSNSSSTLSIIKTQHKPTSFMSSSSSKSATSTTSSSPKTSFPFRSFFNNSNIDRRNVVIKVIELD